MGDPTNLGRVYTEQDWMDVENTKQPYSHSKALAEKAAWDFVKHLPGATVVSISVYSFYFLSAIYLELCSLKISVHAKLICFLFVYFL